MAGVPIMGFGSETDEERRRREMGEQNLAANDASNAAYEAQVATAPPPPEPVLLAQAEPPKSARDAMGIPSLPPGAVVPLPGSSEPAPRSAGVKKPGTDTPIAPLPSNIQGGPSITQRGPGGTTVNLPLAAGADLEQSTSRGSTSRSQREVSKAEREAEKDQDSVRFEQVNNAEQKKQVLINQAKDDQIQQDALQAVAAAKEKDTNDRLNQYEAEVAKRQAIADATETEYKQRLVDWEQRDPKKAFWAKKDTGEKLTAGLSMLLGIVGGLKDGSNVGAERILKAIDADTARAKDVLGAKEKMVASTKGDVQTAKDDIKRHKDLIDLRSAVAKDRVVAEAEARAARLGIPKAEIVGNEGILAIKESAAADRLKLEQSRAATVQQEQGWSRATTNTGGGPAGQDKPLAKWSGAEKEAEGYAQRMASASGEMDKYKYSPADVQSLQNAALQEAVVPKGANAVLNRVIGQVFQRLSPEGKKRWLAEQEFARANLRRESGAAISIAETLSEIEQVGERPGDTGDTLAQKRQQRLMKLRATGISSGRPQYWEGVTKEQAAAPATVAPKEGDISKTPSGIPVIFRGGKWQAAN